MTLAPGPCTRLLIINKYIGHVIGLLRYALVMQYVYITFPLNPGDIRGRKPSTESRGHNKSKLRQLIFQFSGCLP